MAEKMSGAATLKKAQAGSITRTEAVTEALAALGKDVMPMQIKGFIKEKFNIEMSNNAVSSYKSAINRRTATAKPASAVEAKKEPAPKPQAKPPAAKKESVPATIGKTPAPAAVAKKPASAPAPRKEPVPQTYADAATAIGGNAKPGGIELADIQAVKNLVGRLGADQLKTLVDLLSK
jgi:hypothetical protein